MSNLGRGIIASEDIPKGTLLVVSKAFAYGCSKDFPGTLIAINLIRKDVGFAANMLKVVRIMRNLQNNPRMAKQIYGLYAGPTVDSDEKVPDGGF